MPLVSLAAWQALVDRAHVKPGQKVLVHAGSGGLGSTVIQLAKHLGATVATTARGENAELVRSLGADVVVDYTKEDFAEVLSGYDVVLDSRGGENLEKSLTVLKPGGQAIGVTGPPDPGFAKQLGAPKFIGVVMGLLSRKVRKQARKLGVSYSFLFMQANGAQLRELAALYDAGHLRPRHRQDVPVRPDPRGAGVRRAGPRQRQGRHHARLTTPPAAQRLHANRRFSSVDGHAEYIPRVSLSGFRNLAALRGAVRASLTLVSAGVSPQAGAERVRPPPALPVRAPFRSPGRPAPGRRP